VISPARSLRLVTAAGLCATVLTLWPSEAQAQRRGRPAGGRGVVIAAPLYAGYGFYDPFYWGWGPGWGGGWGPGWGFQGGWFPPFGPGWGGSVTGAARLQVTPKQAEVYVDGYLAGSVDDFDGVFQRLNVVPGEHELTIYMEGYQTFTQRVYFQPGQTIDIRERLEPLAPGETSGPRPVAAAPPPGSPGDAGGPDPSAAPRRGPWGPRRESPPVDQPPMSSFGTLAVRVQPADATLLVDGEEWDAPEGDGPILIDLPDGAHEVEVRKEGLPTYRRMVQVRAGRTLPLNVSLSR